MATHSSILAWRIPWTEEPGRLQSMGSLRVRHDWSDSARMRACICQNLLDSVFADSEESLPPCVAGEVLVSVEVAVEGIFVYPADLAPEGTPDEDFVSLIQELSHCGVCMEMRKGSSRYHRLFKSFERIISVYFTTSGVSFLHSSGSLIFLKFCHTFYTLLHFTLWM